jgi:hypothetical protein
LELFAAFFMDDAALLVQTKGHPAPCPSRIIESIESIL